MIINTHWYQMDQNMLLTRTKISALWEAEQKKIFMGMREWEQNFLFYENWKREPREIVLAVH